MADTHVNAVIDRIVRDASFRDQVRSRRETALTGCDLTPAQARAVADATVEDTSGDGEPTFRTLRKLARFEPLFASYSATATKKG